jgi:[acyl-carrier-protein] S-malonyltransferase
MGRDIYESSAAARAVFDTADRVLGYELSRICFEGPEERLRDTAFTQPAIFTVSLASVAAAIETGSIGEAPAFMAGHSLGEYSALVTAGALSLEDGLRLLQERARLMSGAGEISPGTLAAIIGLDEDRVRQICDEAGAVVANLNLPTQTVIGGTREAVARAMEIAKEQGAQRVLELNVSAAFHSPLMQTAAAALAPAIAAATISAPQVPVVGNSTAAAMIDSEGVRAELTAQVASPVLWHQSITLMAKEGVDTFVEFGPGRVLTGLAKRLVPGAKLVNIGSVADLGIKTPAQA